MTSDASRAPSEDLRKAVHVGCGLWALTMRWLPWPAVLALGLCALAFALFVSPRLLGARVHRGNEARRGWSPAIAFYAASVVALVLVFRERLDLVAAGWGLMAFGDGMGTLVGLRIGRHRLPWNPRKSWEGLVAHAVAGATAASALGLWVGLTGPAGGASPPLATTFVAACVLAAVATSFLETLELGIDDNLTVPLAGAGIAWLVVTIVSLRALVPLGEVIPRGGWALAACALLAVAARTRGSLTTAGAAAAAVVGTLVAGGAGWIAFAALCTFFVLGTAATRLGRSIKERRGIAEARGGRRGAGNVAANGGLAALAAIVAALGEGHPLAFQAGIALVAALATAAFDTVSSEVGKAFGRRTFLVTTLRPVPPGTEGAVSLEGTLAGVGASVVVLLVAAVPGEGFPLSGPPALPILLGALAGTTFESVVGALVESRGHRIQNDALNFANTLVGAGAAVALAGIP